MATVPLSGTDISIFTGVPFSNDYKHTRWFDTATEQTNYFNSLTKVHQINFANFQRGENGRTHIKVNASLDMLRKANYLRFRNGHYESKYFYAFVTNLEYVNEKMTKVHFQIDVIQTYRFEWSFLPSYVEREHCKLWNADGTPVVNTLDEGFDYGTEYDTVKFDYWTPYNDNFFLVIVAKNAMHGGTSVAGKVKPVVNGALTPLSYYIHPMKLNGTMPTVQIDGTEVTMTSPMNMLKEMYTQAGAVNNIVSIYITEFLGKDLSFNEGTDTISFPGSNFDHVTIQDTENTCNTLYLAGAAQYDTEWATFGSVYHGYRPVKESKLLMYPYTKLVLDDFKGNRIEYKNEYIDSKTLTVTARGSMGSNNKTSYSIQQYSSPGLSGTELLKLTNETALFNTNPNDVPIVTDLLSAYLQGNKNQIANQKDAAMFGMVNGVNAGIMGAITSPTKMGVLAGANEAIGAVGGGYYQIQGLNAKQKDISNVPPQISKMGSNTHFDYGYGYNGVFLMKKQIKPEYQKKLESFFNAYGYKVNEIKVPNFHTRENWNFVKTIGCNIKGDFNNEDLNEIKAVFDNGITLWHTNAIGSYGYSNEVI